MRRAFPRLAATLSLVLCLLVPGVGGAEPAHAADSTRALAAARAGRVLSDYRVRAARNGTVVLDAASGRVVAQRNASASLAPASNLKLLTTMAALHYLGPDYRFATRVGLRARVRQGRLAGDVYLRGSGDPSLSSAGLRDLARALRRAGVRTIAGDVVADAGAFTGPAYHRSWATPDGSRTWAPQVSGLSLSPDAELSVGTVRINAHATGYGRRARITTTPAGAKGYVKVLNRVTTGGGHGISATRVRGTNTIVVTGRVGTGAKKPARALATVHRPDRYAAHVFRAELRVAGVRVSGAVVAGRTPRGSRVVATLRSRPLGALVRPLLKHSNTGMAEHLLRALGRKGGGPGSMASGHRWVRAYVRASGSRLKGLTLADGSGLAPANRVTVGIVARALRFATRRPWFATYRDALPLAGDRRKDVGGTLDKRMRGTAAAGRVNAKTGTKPGVTALSGFVRSRDGRTYVFAMISNYRGASPRPVEDALAAALAREGPR